MASRDQLLIIRAARAGQAPAQLALGRHYLFGGAGLPKSVGTALHWLDRAARQQMRDAWILIGSHVPFEVALQAADPQQLCVWYEKAFDAGVVQAGLVWVKLIQKQGDRIHDQAIRSKALRALYAAAHAGIADAQWQLAQHGARARNDHSGAPPSIRRARTAARVPLEWTERAADGGVVEARQALAERAWATADYATFLHWSLRLARDIARRQCGDPARLREGDAVLLSRCARALWLSGGADRGEMENLFVLAARAGDKHAQFSFGLLLAKMDVHGRRADGVSDSANYKKAIHWLTLSGRQELAAAWYAISQIYLKSAFSKRNVSDALLYLEKAAAGGHAVAQLELGAKTWHKRGNDAAKTVRALYWLQAAAAQGNADAESLLEKVAPCRDTGWTDAVQRKWAERGSKTPPLLAARIELAAAFGLSRPEALLLDIHAADHGHCLAVDVQAHYARSKPRLVLVRTDAQRQMLNRIAQLFEDIDCSQDGAEGNYRQRLYRLNCTLAQIPLS
jgi:TPR repeat protein